MMMNCQKSLTGLLLACLALALPALAQAPPDVVIVPSPPDYSTPAPQIAAQTPLLAAAPPQADVVLPRGTQVAIRFNRNLKLDSAGSTFQAALSEDLVVGNEVLAPRGTLVRGELIRSYNAQGQPEPALSLTEIWLKNDWRTLQTDPLPMEGRGGSGKGRKFLAGLALAGVIAGDAVSNSGRNGSCPRRRPISGKRLAIGTAAGLGGQLGALLLNRGGGGLALEKVKLKRGQQLRFELAEPVAFDHR